MSFSFFINITALLLSFFVVGVILGAIFSKPIREKAANVLHLDNLILRRPPCNPILRPGKHPWNAEAVLNPAAAEYGGRVHIIYRAIGLDGVSRLGYASSADGITFDERIPYPIYFARTPHDPVKHLRRYSPIMYPSGGSWGGCEDPRMVIIDDRVYVTFNMFENWELRVAVIAMGETDFLAKNFSAWEGPIIISHGERAKNWVLFPEKINGQFAVLHSIIGDDEHHVRIEYIDDLTKMRQRTFISPDPQREPDRKIAWHVHMRSAGPPPIKTDRGWLVFYHAHDAHEGHRYKLGSMLLDLADPTRIIHRAIAPILAPEESYENDGKPGVVFACGAVVRKNEDGEDALFIYYGGADKVVCVATAPLGTFLAALVSGGPASVITVPAQTEK